MFFIRASVIPTIAFFVLLIAGVWMQELQIKHALVLLAVWFLGGTLINYLGLPSGLLVGFVALLDVFLILKIFGGDIRVR